MEETQQNRKKVNMEIVTSTNNALKCSKSPSEGFLHRYIKWLLSNYCWDKGLNFASEVVFRNNTRCDFIIKDWAVIFEVLHNETLKSFKQKEYPFPAIPIRSDISEEELHLMLDDLLSTNGKTWEYYYKVLSGSGE